MNKGKKYVVYGMRLKCDQGTMENYFSTNTGHGIVYQGQPVMNANDHEKVIHLTHFGNCNSKNVFEEAKKEADEKYKAEEGDGFFAKAGKWTAKNAIKAAVNFKATFMSNKCELITPLPWLFPSEDHTIDGAPALTMESLCPCALGGVISIVPVVEEVSETNAIQEDDELIKMLEMSYGFSKEQGALIAKAYNLFMQDAENQKLSKKEQFHKFCANMAGLCINYSGGAIRWSLVCGTPSTIEAMEYFKELGLSEEETFDLLGAINFQHTNGQLLSKPSDYNSQGFCSDKDCNRQCEYMYHITDSKYWKYDYGDAAINKDFAHELIQYACFSNDESAFHVLWGSLEPAMGRLSSLAGYKGDVYSGRMEIDDMNSDMDAINTYDLFSKNNYTDIFETMTEYNQGVSSGKINRAEEFLKILGDGNAQNGYDSLVEELNEAEYGAIYIDRGIKGILQDMNYMNAMITSNASIHGEDMWNKMMEQSPGSQVENKPEIVREREEFLNYVYEEWKK